MERIVVNNNFVWMDVTDKAKDLWLLFDLYELHSSTESKIDSYRQLLDILQKGGKIGIEVGNINKDKPDNELYSWANVFSNCRFLTSLSGLRW